MNAILSPLLLSLKIAVLACLFNLVLALPVAWAVFRIPGKLSAFLDSVLTLPLVLPPTVTGFFLLTLLGRRSPIGTLLESLGLRVVFTWQGALLAAIVVSFPLMFRTTLSAFEQLDPNVLDAARTLGFSEWSIFLELMVPLSFPGIGAGFVLTFARALGEFGATMMVAGNIPGKTQTVSLLIYTATAAGDTALAFRWVLVIMILSLGSTGIMNLWISHLVKKSEGTL